MDVTVPPRLPLGVLPTPLVAADRLRAALGCDPVRLKRDDLAGFEVAGNKTRALEYLLGDAAAGGADVLVTGGGPDSNFIPAAALAARVAGLDCELVVWGSAVPDTGAPDSGRPGGTPNLDLAAAAGPRIRALGDDPPTRGACGAEYDGRERVDVEVQRVAAELAAQGRRPLALPRGRSTGLGAVGFALGAAELVDQWAQRAERAHGPPALVVLSVGSGASCAGLLAGLAAVNWPLLGVSVSRPPADIRARVLDLARQCAELLGTRPPRPEQLEIVDARGPAFGVASPEDRAAAHLALRTGGVVAAVIHTSGGA